MQGGLGFLNPQHEAALHFLQAILPTVEELPHQEDEDNMATRHLAETLDYLDHQAAPPLRPSIAPRYAAPHGPQAPSWFF